MGFLFWIILGGLAGWIASKFTDNDARMGVFSNIVVGIVGAYIGGLITWMLGGRGITGFNVYSLIIATIGAVILLWIVNAIVGKGTRSHHKR